MNEQNWKRIEYTSWEEAFRGLSPIIRQQSVRVAAYTQALFVSACKLRFGKGTKSGRERIRGQFADLAYKCGMYHQLGKALVPPEYQIWQNDFTEEEQAVYKKYTTDGCELVIKLQKRSILSKEKNQKQVSEMLNTNLPSLMIREACEQHMERWDGTGYPSALKGNQISPIAQIIGLAKELDRVAAETRSETPFDMAVKEILSGEGTMWSPELIKVFLDAKEECLTVYNKYIAYTRTLPKTISLVDKVEGRPMGLSYRPMVKDCEGNVGMYEANAWFGGSPKGVDEKDSVEEVRELLSRMALVANMSRYFFYEATDALVRIKNCDLKLDGILINVIPEFYTTDGQIDTLNQIFSEQEIEKSSLLLTIPETLFAEISASEEGNRLLLDYKEAGFALVIDDYHPDATPIEVLEKYGITRVRMDSELYLRPDTAGTIRDLKDYGYTVIGKNADTPTILDWLMSNDASYASGTMTGIPVDEENLVLDSLAREQK